MVIISYRRCTSKSRLHAILRNRQSISSNMNDYSDFTPEHIKPCNLYQIDRCLPQRNKVNPAIPGHFSVQTLPQKKENHIQSLDKIHSKPSKTLPGLRKIKSQEPEY